MRLALTRSGFVGRPPEDRVFAPPEGDNGPELVLLVAPAACQKGSRGSGGRLMHGVDQPKYAGVFRCLQGAGNQTIAERLTIFIYVKARSHIFVSMHFSIQYLICFT